MAHWKLTLSYDGTAYNGWQVQPGLPTVQGTLQQAIASITGTSIADTPLPQGSGRTDSGVHALGQVASFSLSVPIPAENLLHALNRALPPAIRVLAADPVPDTFHARHSVLRKSYEYRLFERRPPIAKDLGAPFMDSSIVHERGSDVPPNRICPPFLAPYVWDCPWPLALELMQQAAALLCGTHDFTSFAAHDPDLTERISNHTFARNFASNSPSPPQSSSSRPKAVGRSGETPVFAVARAEGASVHTLTSDQEKTLGAKTSGPNPVKTIYASEITREQGLLLYRITGSGFLHHMVRNIVGTLTEIGRGALTPEDIPRILTARDRSAAGPTAPAQGLYLVQVDYPPTPAIGAGK